MDRKKLIKRLILLIFLILVVNFFANKFHWYFSIWYFDMIMHFLGGFWVGLLALYFLPLETPSRKSILITLLFVFFVGLGWEVFEIAVNKVIAQNPFNSLDSISDIFFDLFGGLCAILYIWKKLPK